MPRADAEIYRGRMSVSFAVVATPGPTQASWVEQVRMLEDLGYAAVLVPDTLWTVSPFPALAAAAVAAPRIRLRTWVLASPMRTPAAVVREVAALQRLSDGRFELGMGTGRPDAADEAARLGVAWGSASDRVAQLETVVTAVREQVQPRPPVVMAASGPRSLAVAGRVADRVAVALGPQATPADLEAGAARVREAAPHVALTVQAFGVGDRVPDYLARQGFSGADLAESGSVVMLPDDPTALAEQAQEHAERFGVDEIVIPSDFAEAVAPAIALV
jgi:alkanesulfonate monooxygenase SsuD/methylene tetrahydromethanopterin reductase-like flavin-dependent oxidoreductase (luciferase family)